MQNFFTIKDEFGGKIALGIIATAILIGLAREGFVAGRWLATVHHS